MTLPRSRAGRILRTCTVDYFPPSSRLPNRPSSISHPARLLSIAPTSRPVSDDEVAALARRAQHRLSLADLVKHGRPPLSESALLASANFTLSLLPIRLARRIWAFRCLPFCAIANPSIARIYANYQKSLSALLPWLEGDDGREEYGLGVGAAIKTLADERRFSETLAELVETHTNTIPILAKGFLQIRRYVSPEVVTSFLNEHLHARIGTRLIAEQHLSLHNASLPAENQRVQQHPHQNKELAAASQEDALKKDNPLDSWIGVIDTALRPVRTVEMCAGFATELAELRYGVRPAFEINGELDTTFAFVPMHLEYILTELFKNAFRATIESTNASGFAPREPVIVTICPVPPTADSQRVKGLHADAHTGNNDGILPLDDNAPGVTIRIRDRGGGIPADVLRKVWQYSFTTVPEDEQVGLFAGLGGIGSDDGGGGASGLSALSNAGAGGSSIAGLGYGLPLGRAYAEYFGGGITLKSLPGWGTDVYLRLRGVGKM